MTISCPGCGSVARTMDEYAWMVRDRVWIKGVRRAQRRWRESRLKGIEITKQPGFRNKPSSEAIICVGCFEAWLGRTLVWADFNWEIPLNRSKLYARSPRLLRRMRAG